jgi:hypothetical protein
MPKDLTNLLSLTGGIPIPPPPKLTYAQALVRWPLLFRNDRGQFKSPPFGKRQIAVEHRSAYGQPQFGIAGLNTRDNV